MFDAKYYRSAIAIGLSLSTMMASLASLSPAHAQLFPSNGRSSGNNNQINNDIVIPAGVTIPLEYDKEKVLVTKEETIELTLTVAANIRDRDRNTLIPYGTEVLGQIEPSGNGSVFIADQLIFADGSRQYINARSETVTRTETVKRGKDVGDVLKGAAIGSAAAAVLSEIFGDISVGEVLIGTGLGAITGLLLGGNEVELVSINPNQDLDITLDSDLALR
ncbi:hypothetical protein [Xenococcus sp. PCC 7305]|uniref:hypothetical protein n=1 Tax=Xenococcus sp. PCC 7305 TaxID=102125 RepID=UPI000593596A|nr:hypothetical protein [Xenococcus sp. PCC 7305]